eukprot:gnl/MRDRNA2_/MRDRNA2_109456_c0_seq1.p1 gnl/MRDRNA2_/MRDRNA2_109456_c0~~gnl/MRDRNA2_/MRDRNA2_109456_c0_seq1.p1  ORF type:complete len:224 (+),score=41.59 gnl/MRDRNA2_/MRDRNA2_109456_c0_seq1:46-672(+)
MASPVSDVSQGLQRLNEALSEIAPKLSPCVVPCARPAGATLGTLYKNEDGFGDRLRAAAQSAGVCSICSAKLVGEGSSWGIEWSVDLAKRRQGAKRCVMLCSLCGEIWNLPALIERLTAQHASKQNDAGTSELLQHFLRVNGHDLSEVQKLQDTVSIAYAAFILHKQLRLEEVRQCELSEFLQRSFPNHVSKDAAKSVGEPKKKRRKA